ncbi:MAG: hypothetical protein F6K24_07425, partial [Okeania sp. SIO2D1]|nr:hypothetical protein [Okeania sp. SIO2D1]
MRTQLAENAYNELTELNLPAWEQLQQALGTIKDNAELTAQESLDSINQAMEQIEATAKPQDFIDTTAHEKCKELLSWLLNQEG